MGNGRSAGLLMALPIPLSTGTDKGVLAIYSKKSKKNYSPAAQLRDTQGFETYPKIDLILTELIKIVSMRTYIFF